MTVFFGNGIVVADFRQEGIVAVDRNRLKIFVKTAESCSAHSHTMGCEFVRCRIPHQSCCGLL